MGWFDKEGLPIGAGLTPWDLNVELGPKWKVTINSDGTQRLDPISPSPVPGLLGRPLIHPDTATKMGGFSELMQASVNQGAGEVMGPPTPSGANEQHGAGMMGPPEPQSGSGPVEIKNEHTVNTSTGITGRSKREIAAKQAARDMEAKGLTDAQERVGELDAGLARKRAVDREAYMQDKARVDDEFEGKLRDLDGDKADAYEEYKKLTKNASKDIDPNRYWNNLPAANKLAVGLASAFAGFSKGFTRGQIKDEVTPLIDRFIQRDLASQQSDRQNAWRGVSAQQQLINNLRADGRDIRQAKKDAVLILKENFLDRVALEADKIGDEKARQVAKFNTAKVRLELAGSKVREAVQTAARYQSSKTTKKQTITGDTSRLQKKAVPNKKVQDKHADFMGGIAQITDVMGKVKSMWGKYGWALKRVPGTDSKRLYDAALKTLAVDLRQASETGIMTEPDYQRYKAIIDAPFQTAHELIQRLRMVKRGMLKRHAAKLKSYGHFQDVTPYKAEVQREWDLTNMSKKGRRAE